MYARLSVLIITMRYRTRSRLAISLGVELGGDILPRAATIRELNGRPRLTSAAPWVTAYQTGYGRRTIPRASLHPV